MGRKTFNNIYATDEKWDLVCEDNKDLLDEFVEYCHTTDKSDLTVKNYISDIRIYFCWNLENNKNKLFANITKRDVMKFQNWSMNILGHSPSRVRRLRSSLSSMSNFIENVLDEEEMYEGFRNIINKIPAPINSKVREKTVLGDEDIQLVLDTLVENKKYQKACAFALSMASGARKAELTRFKTDYFSDDNVVFGCMYQTPEKIKTKGRGKKGKLLHKYTFIDQFKPYFDLWMQERERKGIDSEWLFVKRSKGQYVQATDDTLTYWTEHYTKILDKPFYFHSNRHYWTTRLRKLGLPDNVIKQLQGWESVEMVDIYSDESIEDTLGKYFDEGGIKQVETATLANL